MDPVQCELCLLTGQKMTNFCCTKFLSKSSNGWHGLTYIYDKFQPNPWYKIWTNEGKGTENASSNEGMNGVNRLATMGEKYYWLPTKWLKNYRLPTGKI